ncbi:MAG: hypothetical protein LBK91_05790, partial [Synergistaceae bacterium]|nr:hypothetical protein [Synergistaceae bacterium]
MRKFFASIISILCVFFALAFPAMNPPAAAAAIPGLGNPVERDREWTVLVYMDADNNLESDGLADVLEMERGMPENANIDVVLMIDRAKGYDDSMGDWTGTRIYHVTRSAGEAISSELLADCGEQNMGDPAVLESFIKAGAAKYPARHAALVLWDHGGGWIGMLNDDDDAGDGADEITLAELENALSRTAGAMPGGKFDLLLFDMCLMGQAEAVTAMAPFANYMVA